MLVESADLGDSRKSGHVRYNVAYKHNLNLYPFYFL